MINKTTQQKHNWIIIKNSISICKIRGYDYLINSYLEDINNFINAVNIIGINKVLNYYKENKQKIPQKLKEVLNHRP